MMAHIMNRTMLTEWRITRYVSVQRAVSISVTRTERERSLWQLPSEGSLGTDQSMYT